MRKMLVIAVREYQAAVRSKSFFISLALLPLFIGGSVLFQVWLQKQEETQERHFAIVDRTSGQELARKIEEEADRQGHKLKLVDPLALKPKQADFTLERVEPAPDPGQQRFELSEQVREGKLDGFLEIGPNIYSDDLSAQSDALRYQSRTPDLDAFSRWAEELINEIVHEKRLAEAGLRTRNYQVLLKPVPMVRLGLSDRNPQTGAIEDATGIARLAPLLVPAGLMSLMLMMIMFGSTPLLQGVFEEKMQRIAEVLLGSVRPFQLMMGKLIGMVGVSMTTLAVYIGVMYCGAYRYGFLAYVPWTMVAWFILFQVLAVLMYGSLFIAIGAACTDAKETQTFVLPVALLACLPLLVVRYVIQEPNSGLVTALSFFPFATPMLMVGRQAVPPGIAWWQPLLGVVVVLLTTMGCVYAAGRIFRVGILLQGKGARIGELIKWVFQG